MSSNRIESVEQYVIRNLPDSLEYVTVSENRFRLGWYAFEISSVKNVKYIDISSQFKERLQYFSQLRIGCDDTSPVVSDMAHEADKLNPPGKFNRPVKYGTCMSEYMRKTMPLPKNGQYSVFFCMPPSLKEIILSHSSVESNKMLDYVYFDFRYIQSYSLSDNMRTNLASEIFSSNTTYLDYSQNFISKI